MALFIMLMGIKFEQVSELSKGPPLEPALSGFLILILLSCVYDFSIIIYSEDCYHTENSGQILYFPFLDFPLPSSPLL